MTHLQSIKPDGLVQKAGENWGRHWVDWIYSSEIAKYVAQRKKGKASNSKESEEVWDTPNPKKKSTPLTPKQKAMARARAKKAGRPYPNMIDNMAAAKDDEEEMEKSEGFTIEVPITKVDEESMQVFGWAQVITKADGTVVVDKQGDVVMDVSELENAAYDYVISSRDSSEMHVRRGVATLIESIVFTPEKIAKMGLPEGSLPIGWWTGYQVLDQNVWEDVKSGKYRMFSVHGTGKRTLMEEDNA